MSHSFPSRGSSTYPWYTVGGKISDKNMEWINIKFCVKIGKSANETFALLTLAHSEYAMKKSSVFEWHRRFKEGWGDVQDDQRSGKTKTQSTNHGALKSKIRWYLEVLTRLRESVWRKRPELWPDKWILHHDNAPAHDALRVREFLAKKSVVKMPPAIFGSFQN
jgi:hypothetical protein